MTVPRKPNPTEERTLEDVSGSGSGPKPGRGGSSQGLTMPLTILPQNAAAPDGRAKDGRLSDTVRGRRGPRTDGIVTL